MTPCTEAASLAKLAEFKKHPVYEKAEDSAKGLVTSVINVVTDIKGGSSPKASKGMASDFYAKVLAGASLFYSQYVRPGAAASAVVIRGTQALEHDLGIVAAAVASKGDLTVGLCERMRARINTSIAIP